MQLRMLDTLRAGLTIRILRKRSIKRAGHGSGPAMINAQPCKKKKDDRANFLDEIPRITKTSGEKKKNQSRKVCLNWIHFNELPTRTARVYSIIVGYGILGSCFVTTNYKRRYQNGVTEFISTIPKCVKYYNNK